MMIQEVYVNDSTNQAPHPTVQDALAELPIFAAMLAVANVAAAVVLFQRARFSVGRRLGLTTE